MPRCYATPAELLADTDVDAVYVATPPGSHRDYAVAAAEAGKHVYVEKPMARTGAECDAMIVAAERAGVDLYVAYYRRALPRFVAAERAIADGRIGRAALGRRAVVAGPARRRRLAPRSRDLRRWLVRRSRLPHPRLARSCRSGRCTVVASEVDGGPAESRVDVALTTTTGLPVTGQWRFDASEHVDEIAIHGSEGTLRMSTFGTEAPVLTDGAHEVTLSSGPAPAVVQEPLIANVVDAIRGDAEPLSTGRTAARTSHLIDDGARRPPRAPRHRVRLRGLRARRGSPRS